MVASCVEGVTFSGEERQCRLLIAHFFQEAAGATDHEPFPALRVVMQHNLVVDHFSAYHAGIWARVWEGGWCLLVADGLERQYGFRNECRLLKGEETRLKRKASSSGGMKSECVILGYAGCCLGMLGNWPARGPGPPCGSREDSLPPRPTNFQEYHSSSSCEGLYLTLY